MGGEQKERGLTMLTCVGEEGKSRVGFAGMLRAIYDFSQICQPSREHRVSCAGRKAPGLGEMLCPNQKRGADGLRFMRFRHLWRSRPSPQCRMSAGREQVLRYEAAS
jgi:hypothetical protein